MKKSDHAKIVEEAKKRFDHCEEHESDARKLFLEDLKFANADAHNGWQWPEGIRKTREDEDKPCLTLNYVRQHNLQIINDARQNKPAMKARPMGDGASIQSAKVFDGIFRHIEYISNAQAAYDTATRFQVQGGIGYWRVVTDYASPDSFDQDIFVRRVKDPLSVYLDPDINEVDGSDARFGFVFDDMPRDKFELAYPGAKAKVGEATLGNTDSWLGEKHVRVAEYFRKVEKGDRLVLLPDTGETVRESTLKMMGKVHADVMADPRTRTRDITGYEVHWYLIAGDTVIDDKPWPGCYIPIVRVVAEETLIEGELDRKGHTRAMMDAQRMKNYWFSGATENVALQSKSPYVAPAAAIEGYEDYWRTANTDSHAVLPYNHVSDDGQSEIPAPKRQEPPVMAPAFITGMQSADMELMRTSGQFQAELGMPGNEKSGVAIQQRQRQGDNATYHYIDHLAIAIRFTGKIILDLIPKIYDTERVLRVLTESGEEMDVTLDPRARQALQQVQGQHQAEVKRIFNPNVGRYEVEADIGPAYATRRQEAFAAYSQILAQNKELITIAGDIIFKAADFPGADELAERLKNMVPAQAMGGPSPELAEAQGELQKLNGVVQQLLQQLAESKLDAKRAAADRSVQAFDADTRRINAENGAAFTDKDAGRAMQAAHHETHRTMLGIAAQHAAPPPEPALEAAE